MLQVLLGQCMCCRFYLVSACVAGSTWSVRVLQVLLGQCMCCRFYLVSACVAGSTWSVHVLQVLLGQCMCCRFYLVSACVAGSTWSVRVLQVLLGQCMTDVLKLLRVVSVSDESLLSLLMEERPLSPATVQSGQMTMGTAMTMTATPTNVTVGTMGTTETTGTAEERVQVSGSDLRRPGSLTLCPVSLHSTVSSLVAVFRWFNDFVNDFVNIYIYILIIIIFYVPQIFIVFTVLYIAIQYKW